MMGLKIGKSGFEMRDVLLKIAVENRIHLEGALLRVIQSEESDEEFTEYLKECKDKDIETRRKRLNLTRQVQQQNEELTEANEKNCKLVKELESALSQSKSAETEARDARKLAENLKDNALRDLDVLQRRTRFKLIGLIVKIALGIIVGVGILTTLLYVFVILTGGDSTIIETTWSNLFGILLTNSFSIIGTIMGVRYASKDSPEEF